MFNKTIIQVWTHKTINHHQDNYNGFWGLGDMIRGTIKLYQLCKEKNYNFIVDLHLHSISKYLIIENNPYEQLIEDNKNNIELVFPGNVENYINMRESSEIIYFFTNDQCDLNITYDTKEFIKKLLTTNDEFNLYFNSKINEMPYNNYNIIHFRFGDDELVREIKKDYNTYYNILLKNKEDNDILISDSIIFKNNIKEKYNIFIFNTNPQHVGYQKDSDSLKDTLFEFLIMKNATKIKTYSYYGWISGFTFWISNIYDIPLINMNN